MSSKVSINKPSFSTARLNCQLVTDADADFIATLYQSPVIMSHIADAMAPEQALAAPSAVLMLPKIPPVRTVFGYWLLLQITSRLAPLAYWPVTIHPIR